MLGKVLRVSGYTYPIIGVMPDSVRFPAPDVDFWAPAKLPPGLIANTRVTVGERYRAIERRSHSAIRAGRSRCRADAPRRSISRNGRQLDSNR